MPKKPPTQTHQSGIENRPPEHNLVAALVFTGPAETDSAVTRAAIMRLQGVVKRELSSDLDDQDAATPKHAPGPETGELGFDDKYDRAHLTITLGIGSTGFERLGVAVEDRPQDLIPIPWDQLLDQPVNRTQGDLVLQICSDDAYICEHALRRVEEELSDVISVAWTIFGSQRYTTRQGRTSREEGRALIGFIDGTSNLNPRHDEADAALTYVDPDNVGDYPPLPQAQHDPYTQHAQFPPDLRTAPTREPQWTRSGSYMVIRASVQDISQWDDLSLGEQEAIIGRFKFSGASLDLADQTAMVNESPAFATDPTNLTVAVDSHSRKANPRRPDDLKRRLFRRGYPLIVPSASGSVQRGLLFICFGRTISTQFEFIMRAWMKNENFPSTGAGIDRLLRLGETVLVGGYYFVPPVYGRNKPWAWVLPW